MRSSLKELTPEKLRARYAEFVRLREYVERVESLGLESGICTKPCEVRGNVLGKSNKQAVSFSAMRTVR
jgi:hypothetical protein